MLVWLLLRLKYITLIIHPPLLVSIYCPFISSLPGRCIASQASLLPTFICRSSALLLLGYGSDFRAGSWIDCWFYPKYPCFVYIAVFPDLHLSQCLFQKSVTRFPHLLLVTLSCPGVLSTLLCCLQMTVTWSGSTWSTSSASRAGSRASLLSRLILRSSRPST